MRLLTAVLSLTIAALATAACTEDEEESDTTVSVRRDSEALGSLAERYWEVVETPPDVIDYSGLIAGKNPTLRHRVVFPGVGGPSVVRSDRRMEAAPTLSLLCRRPA